MIAHLEAWQWAFGATAALMVGVTKTGIPGIGILIVPLLATAFGGRTSIGIMLPMLIFGDFFAVAWYRRHAQWDKLVGLLPWVVVGMAIGASALWAMGEAESGRDILGMAIGILVIVMLALYLLQGRLGEALTPTSRIGVAATGVGAGFATTVSNAAGSIMSVYMAAHRVTKEQFMGTLAWYYFVINCSKVPIYIALSAANPAKPIMTLDSIRFVGMTSPAIVVGVFVGRWILPRISQEAFEGVVLVLAAAAASKLIVG